MDKKISEIAKELDVKPGVVIDKLKEIGISVDNITSTISLNQENALLDHMGVKRSVTAKKVTKVTEDGNTVSKKKIVVKASPKKKASKAKTENSENGKPKSSKTGKSMDRKKVRVTVIKKHRDEEDKEETEKSALENKSETTENHAPKKVKKTTKKTAQKKQDDAGKKTDESKKDEPKKETPVKKETKKTMQEKKAKTKSAKNVEKAHEKSKKEDKEDTGHKLGLTGKKIEIPSDKPIKKNSTKRAPAAKKNDLKIPDVDFDVAEEKAKSNKKSTKSTYKKGPYNDKAAAFKEKKTPSIKQSYTNPRNRKYRNNQIIGAAKRKVNEVLSDEFILNEYYSNDNLKRRRNRTNKGGHKPKREVLTNVKLPETMTVKKFAEIIKKQSTDVIKKLMELDVMTGINDEIDFDTAALVAEEYNIAAELEETVTEEDILFEDEEEINEENLETRPPVVVVMGHVDHGKTSLLDTIRNTNVVATEAGAITQHVGAYRVFVGERQITFLDTPGHEAFTAMRKRGAQATDIAIIVVAADDGIMPQTVEALNHAKEAGVSIIVAINKIDLPTANPDRIKQELTEYGVVPEEWGGDVICVPISAKTGENIDNLLEMVLLTADVLELKEDPTRQAKGIVIESKLDVHRGPVATLLVKQGNLYDGDVVISGVSVGKIRTMTDENGNELEEAGPSMPVVITGLDEVPGVGETFYGVEDEKTARSLAERRKTEIQQQESAKKPTSLDELFGQIQEGGVKELKIIVKGDVRGSVEAVKDSLEKISNEEVSVKVIHGAVGTITESDVTLAEVADAIIIGFNVRPGNNVNEAAKAAGVDIRLYRVIYKAVEDVESAIKGMLEPKYQENVTGHAEIRQIFKASGIGTIGGCMVTDGKIKRESDIRVVRNGIVVYEGKLESLRRFQDDVKVVQSGYECGLSIEKFNDIKAGDVIEGYEMTEVRE